jgi:predicted ArsR family transcriptional regulator
VVTKRTREGFLAQRARCVEAARELRYEAIVRLLHKRGELRIAELAAATKVSNEMTRRHMEALERSGRVVARLESLPELDARLRGLARRAVGAKNTRRSLLYRATGTA